jgi:hypothetical protein
MTSTGPSRVGVVRQMRSLSLVILATLAISGCATQTTPSANSPAVSQTVVPTTQPPPVASSATASATAAPSVGPPIPSGLCLDTGDLADTADPVVTVMQSLLAAINVPNVAEARTDASTAESGLKRLAAFVNPVQPAAAKDLTTAANELEQASSQFPAGLTLVTQAKANLTAGLQLAGTAGCPD